MNSEVRERIPSEGGRPARREENGRRPKKHPEKRPENRSESGSEAERQPKAKRLPERSRAVVKRDEQTALDTAPKRDASQQKPEYVRIKTSPDRILIVLILALVSIGSIIVFSASYPYAISKGFDSYYFVRRQVIFVALGLVGMTVAMRIPYDKYKKLAYVIYGFAMVLLIVVLVFGVSEGEAKRWIKVPGIGMTIQPSEIMKIGIILMLSAYIGKYAEYIRGRNGSLKLRFLYGTVYPAFIIFPVLALVLLEKHLSGTIILFMISMIVLFLGGTNILMTGGLYGSAGIAAAAMYLMMNPYALKRITTYGNENADILSDKWQTTQGLYAIGSGGLFGLGIGQSRQKYSYVSQPQNDFIFTIWCEETGYIGALFVIALFMALLFRGFTVARRAPDVFSSLVVYGIMSHITLQAILNIAVVTDSIPNTGISLPFFSYGGSSLIMLMFEMGIVLSVSRHSRQQKL